MPNLFTKIQSKRIPSIFLPYGLVFFLPNKPAAKCSISLSFHFLTPYCSVLLTRLHSCFHHDLYDTHALSVTITLYTLLPTSDIFFQPSTEPFTDHQHSIIWKPVSKGDSSPVSVIDIDKIPGESHASSSLRNKICGLQNQAFFSLCILTSKVSMGPCIIKC